VNHWLRGRLLFVVTEDWYFVSHRLALAVEARRAGFDVAVVTRFGSHRRAIEGAGLRAIPFEMNRRGLNPLALMREALALAGILRRERPDVVHLVALRPVVVGGLAVRMAGVSGIVSAVTGMGFLFTDGGRLPWVRRVVQRILPWLLSRGLTIVQNADDAKQLSAFGLSTERLRLIPGAGVDTAHFAPGSEPEGKPVVMMAARLLWDKGIGEFIEAARAMRGSDARFVLVGSLDPDNPASVSRAEIEQWVSEGVVEWWGHSEDMAATLARADLVCLPSYREGLPKVLLEAMACGKACIATDVPGCRDAIRHEDNGLLVPARDAAALASAIRRLCDHPDECQRMGVRGRERALEEFSQERVIEATLSVYREALS
jgi:glycosyltransferase involved in cell wall biosynthesis